VYVSVYLRVGVGVSVCVCVCVTSSRVHHPVPIRAVVDFHRVSAIAVGAWAQVHFAVTDSVLMLTDEHGDKIVYAGTHVLTMTDGSGANSVTIAVKVLNDIVVQRAVPFMLPPHKLYCNCLYHSASCSCVHAQVLK
jgi:hypothetical protein